MPLFSGLAADPPPHRVLPARYARAVATMQSVGIPIDLVEGRGGGGEGAATRDRVIEPAEAELKGFLTSDRSPAFPSEDRNDEGAPQHLGAPRESVELWGIEPQTSRVRLRSCPRALTT